MGPLEDVYFLEVKRRRKDADVVLRGLVPKINLMFICNICFALFGVFQDRASWCNLGYPGIPLVNQAVLEVRNLSISTFLALEFRA